MTRPIRVDGDIAYVPLTRGYEAVIDAADVPLVSGVSWQATSPGVSGRIYAVHSKSRSRVHMHRLLAGDGEGLVDHIDNDPLNNRRQNLRRTTHQQNVMNQKVRRDNLSGYKGVQKATQPNRWRARITVCGVRKFLGYFRSAEDAYAAYCKASAELHGEFGRTS